MNPNTSTGLEGVTAAELRAVEGGSLIPPTAAVKLYEFARSTYDPTTGDAILKNVIRFALNPKGGPTQPA